MNDRVFARMTASMDQKRAAAAAVGNKETVSELELLVLANLANVGLLYLLSLDKDASTPPEDLGELAEAIGESADSINCEFAKPRGSGNGVLGMVNAGAAVLSGDRFAKFIMRRTK